MFRQSVVHIFLPELIAAERDNSNKFRLTLKQRFQFCTEAMNKMAELHEKNFIPECLGLHGVIIYVDAATSAAITSVRFNSILLPTKIVSDHIITNSGYAFDDLFITTTDTTLSIKSSIQLLGLLFFKIFQPLIYGEHFCNFNSLDPTSQQRLLDILGQMTHPDPDRRPTLTEALESLTLIKSSCIEITYGPSDGLIKYLIEKIRLKSHFINQNLDTWQLTSIEVDDIKRIAEEAQSEISSPAAAVAAAASACIPNAHVFFKMNNSAAKLSNASDDLESLSSLPNIYDNDPTMDIYQNF